MTPTHIPRLFGASVVCAMTIGMLLWLLLGQLLPPALFASVENQLWPVIVVTILVVDTRLRPRSWRTVLRWLWPMWVAISVLLLWRQYWP